MNNDAYLTNIGSGGVLDLGAYRAIGSGSSVTLRGGSDAIGTIGTAGTGTDTVVTLSGPGSTIGVYSPSTGNTTSLDASLSTVAQTGRLEILAGRNFTVSANGGAFSNAGVVQLGGGTFIDASYANAGLTYGFGTTGAIANTGTVEASGGTLSTGAIIGASGIVRVDAAATLDLSGAGGPSSAGTLANNGTLALGTRNVTVTSDYTNANFGTGNAFNGRADVTGTGLVLAASATQTLSGSGYGNGTLNVGNVRVGQSTSASLTVTNNGTSTELRGAVQNTNAPGVTLANADFAIAAGGGSSTTTIGFSGTTAGSLAGQSLSVVNNFDNVGKSTVALQGNVYQTATPGSEPPTITLAPVRAGTASSSATVTIQNTAPATNGFTESLRSTVTGSSGFLTNGDGPVTNREPGRGRRTERDREPRHVHRRPVQRHRVDRQHLGGAGGQRAFRPRARQPVDHRQQHGDPARVGADLQSRHGLAFGQRHQLHAGLRDAGGQLVVHGQPVGAQQHPVDQLCREARRQLHADERHRLQLRGTPFAGETGAARRRTTC